MHSNTNTEKSSMTLDDLALIVKGGFEKVDSRFGGIDARLDKIEVKIEDLIDSTKRGFDEQTRNLEEFKAEMLIFRDRTEKRLAMRF